MASNTIDRTTPVGLLHYAHSYAASAIALYKLNIEAIHPHAPVRFLFSHSIELYFKAFLLCKGLSLDQLRSRELGHNLEALMAASMLHGLQISDIQQQQIIVANSAILDRYIEIGFRTIPLPEALLDICKVLNEQIGKMIYSANGISRNPPVLRSGFET